MAIDLTKIDLRKKLVFDLTKEKGIENQKAQVVLCMDISGSMTGLYRNGTVQDIIERIVPIALQFDDNGELDLYLFESSCRKHKNTVTLKNLDGLVNREILGTYDFGGTSYAPPIKMILSDSGSQSSGGFLGMGKKSTKLKYPVYVIFITDGENSDRSSAEQAITDASKHGIFFQFVGIGNEHFSFLKKLDTLSGRFIDNANFFQISNISSMTDQDLYSKLLNEFPDWLKLAKEKNLIDA